MIYEEDFENGEIEENLVEPLLVRKVEAASDTIVENLSEQELAEITGGGSIGGTVKNGGTYDVYISKNATNFKITNAMLGGLFSRFVAATINFYSTVWTGKATVTDQQVKTALRKGTNAVIDGVATAAKIIGSILLWGKDKNGNDVQVKVRIHAI